MGKHSLKIVRSANSNIQTERWYETRRKRVADYMRREYAVSIVGVSTLLPKAMLPTKAARPRTIKDLPNKVQWKSNKI